MSDSYGVAIDIGTSTIRLSCWNLKERELIALDSYPNPQRSFGEDIITRIESELKRPSSGRSLIDVLRSSLNQHIDRLLETQGIASSALKEIVVVGNTAMHHFLFGLPLSPLVEEPYQTKYLEQVSLPAAELSFDFESANIIAPPLVGSYVGSDALCVLLASNLMNRSGVSLALDIGTNSEVMLVKDGEAWVSSAASGPAFEGMSLRCGIPASKGAIMRVEMIPAAKGLRFDTLDGSPAIGFSGVGVISALSVLRQMGLLDSNGSIVPSGDSKGVFIRNGMKHIDLGALALSPTLQELTIDQQEARMLQQSKASIRAVIELLMSEARLSSNMIQTLVLTGEFGNGLDIKSAQAIDLLPRFPNLVSCERMSNGALMGAERILLDSRMLDYANTLREKIHHVDMMAHPRYQETHARFLFFP